VKCNALVNWRIKNVSTIFWLKLSSEFSVWFHYSAPEVKVNKHVSNVVYKLKTWPGEKMTLEPLFTRNNIISCCFSGKWKKKNRRIQSFSFSQKFKDQLHCNYCHCICLRKTAQSIYLSTNWPVAPKSGVGFVHSSSIPLKVISTCILCVFV
jgi:hypothetical protein